MLAKVRSFFLERRAVEVDLCSLVPAPSLDANIDSLEMEVLPGRSAYLHTSPEFAMKRLLAEGIGDLYYLGHVYRKGELGALHNPEFTMIEWYRKNMGYDAFIDEACVLIELFLGRLPHRRLTYREAFMQFAGIDPFGPSTDWPAAAKKQGLSLPDTLSFWHRNDWLDLFLTHLVEPHLGQNELTILCEYPSDQAALAKVVQKEGRCVAERFEIYYRGVELLNGYHELQDATVQRTRFEEENRRRISQGKKPYPLDHAFLDALGRGLPDCCGASIGFDRLLMLQLGLPSIHSCLAFSFSFKEEDNKISLSNKAFL